MCILYKQGDPVIVLQKLYHTNIENKVKLWKFLYSEESEMINKYNILTTLKGEF